GRQSKLRVRIHRGLLWRRAAASDGGGMSSSWGARPDRRARQRPHRTTPGAVIALASTLAPRAVRHSMTEQTEQKTEATETDGQPREEAPLAPAPGESPAAEAAPAEPIAPAE